MKRYVFGGAALLLLLATMFGASAFTSADISRDATIGVTADNQSIIALEPGTVGDAVALNTNGELRIDATPGTTSGLNVEANFAYGDNTTPTSNYAFSITNADSTAHQMTLQYNNIVNNQGVSNAVEFEVYNSSGSHIGTVTSANDVQLTANAGSTYYVVIEVHTQGLDSGADLSGDFEITV